MHLKPEKLLFDVAMGYLFTLAGLVLWGVASELENSEFGYQEWLLIAVAIPIVGTIIGICWNQARQVKGAMSAPSAESKPAAWKSGRVMIAFLFSANFVALGLAALASGEIAFALFGATLGLLSAGSFVLVWHLSASNFRQSGWRW